MAQLKHETMKTLLSELKRQGTAIKTLTNDLSHEVPQKRDKKVTLYQIPFCD